MRYSLYILSGMVGAVATMIVAVAVLPLIFNFSFLDSSFCSVDGGFTYCFFDSKWDSETYLSIISSFYSGIITILVALLGLVSVLAFLLIRQNVLRDVQNQVEQELPRFFETRAGAQALRDEVERHRDEALSSIKGQIELIEIALEENEIIINGRLGGG